MEELFQLFEGLARLGPGSEASTLRALHMLPMLPAEPRILDLGCGAGASSLILARETRGMVAAIDVHQPFLDDLDRRAAAAGLEERIKTRCGSMGVLNDPLRSYDLIWSEGAVYLIGFERGLRLWRPLLRASGFLCVTEATWLTEDPPAEARMYWDEAYPAMGTIDQNLERAKAAGYDPLGTFSLPKSDWEDEYYAPLVTRMDALRADPAFAPVIAETNREIELYRRFGDSYGYVFYALRAAGASLP